MKLKKLSKVDTLSNKTFSFNFSYITKNQNYNLDRLQKFDLDFVGQFSKRFFNALRKLSLITTKEFISCGYFRDIFYFYEIKNAYKGDLLINDDEKIFSVELASKSHERLVLYKTGFEEDKSIFYILLIDYDFSAYKH